MTWGSPLFFLGLETSAPAAMLCPVPCAPCHAGPQFRCLKKKEMTAASDVLCEPALVPSGICLNPNPTVFWGQLSHFIRPLLPHLQSGTTDLKELGAPQGPPWPGPVS